MRRRVLGAQHHRPLRIRVDRQETTCPLTRCPQPAGLCARCPYLQGTIDGEDPVVLCAAPARRPPAHRRRRRLIFDTDWPDEPV